MIIVIGSSSKISESLSKLNKSCFFIGRNNPFLLDKWQRGYDLSTTNGINSEVKLLKEFLEKSNDAKDINLVLLTGISSENWEISINVNLLASAEICDTFASHVDSNGLKGSITLIGSISTYLGGKLTYSMTKASLVGLMNSINAKYSPNVRVNIITPGAFEGGMTKDWEFEKINKISESTNAKRLAKPDEIAKSILFCTENKYLSGSNINLTNGAIKM
jgi:3-oxoacyl-[acyl-carrier protein] reductase